MIKISQQAYGLKKTEEEDDDDDICKAPQAELQRRCE